MNRTTIGTLRTLVEYLNQETGHATEAYTKQADGTYKPNAGNYHLYMAYGAYGLDQMCDTGTGVNTIFHLTTKKELEAQIRAYRRGIEVAK